MHSLTHSNTSTNTHLYPTNFSSYERDIIAKIFTPTPQETELTFHYFHPVHPARLLFHLHLLFPPSPPRSLPETMPSQKQANTDSSLRWFKNFSWASYLWTLFQSDCPVHWLKFQLCPRLNVNAYQNSAPPGCQIFSMEIHLDCPLLEIQ